MEWLRRVVLDPRTERFIMAVIIANAVVLGRIVVLSSCSASLRRSLEERGYRVIETPLDAFQRAGGSACCLTLRLDHASEVAQARPARRAARG